ncbi:hypothetical protein cypCar_00013105, partial [Cyprinus carpio]
DTAKSMAPFGSPKYGPLVCMLIVANADAHRIRFYGKRVRHPIVLHAPWMRLPKRGIMLYGPLTEMGREWQRIRQHR